MIPRPDLGDDGEIIDPRTELMEKLINYTKYRDAADMLQHLATQRSIIFQRQFIQRLILVKILKWIIILVIPRFMIWQGCSKRLWITAPLFLFELFREPIKLEEQKEMIKKYFDGEGKIIFNNLVKFKVKNGNHCDILSSSRLGKGRYFVF